MAISCSSCLPVDRNAGVLLGLILGVAARNGRDKVTLITSPDVWDFGAWLEQLLAESTGKEGKGLIPVDREPLGNPEVYGNDRVFAYIRTETAIRSGAGPGRRCPRQGRPPGDSHRVGGHLQSGSRKCSAGR
jgi:transaldolase/glucose-6-phosphate isomerase